MGKALTKLHSTWPSMRICIVLLVSQRVRPTIGFPVVVGGGIMLPPEPIMILRKNGNELSLKYWTLRRKVLRKEIL
jgi:hypothetical protein